MQMLTWFYAIELSAESFALAILSTEEASPIGDNFIKRLLIL